MSTEEYKNKEVIFPQQGSIVFFIVGIILAVLGAEKIVSMHLKNTTYLPIDVVVLSTQLAVYRDIEAQDDSYKPIVSYSYQLKNESYTASEVFSIPFDSKDKEWAGAILAQFKIGDKTQAFYNPTQPADAYLIRNYPFFQYFIALGSLILFLFSAAVASISGEPGECKTPRKVQERKFEIKALSGMARRKIAFAIGCISSVTISVPVMAHYFYYAPPPHESLAYSVAVIIGIVFIFCNWNLIGYIRLGKSLKEIRLYTNTDSFSIGDTINLTASLELKKNLLIKRILCGIDAELSGKNPKRYYTWRVMVIDSQRVNTDEMLNFSCIVNIPHGSHPSSPPRIDEESDFYSWKLVVQVFLSGHFDYTVRYPIYVE